MTQSSDMKQEEQRPHELRQINGTLDLEIQMENFLNELLEIETLTATIAANLRVIRDGCNDLADLDSLESQTAKIAANLRAIQQDPNDLDELQRQSDKILGNLRSIQQP